MPLESPLCHAIGHHRTTTWAGMIRGLCTSLYLLVASPIFAPTPERRRFMRRHQEAVREIALSQSVSEDSGHWDYALLLFYDEFVHSFLFTGFVTLTNFGWTERTALFMADVFNARDTHTLVDMCKNAASTFTVFSRNFTLFLVIFWGALSSNYWIVELFHAVRTFFSKE